MNKKILLNIIIVAFLVLLLLTQVEIADIFTLFFSIPIHYLLLGFILYVICSFLRALRFLVLLNKKIDLRDLFAIVCIHNMLINTLPSRIGELSYIYLVKKIDVPIKEGVTTLILARILDFFVISGFFMISVLYINLLSIWIIELLILILLILIVLIHRGKSSNHIIKNLSVTSHVSMSFMDHIHKRLGRISFNMIEKRTIFLSVLLSIFIWATNYGVTLVIIMGMNLDLNIFETIIAVTLTVLASMLPIHGIGGFGTTEGAWTIAAMSFGISKEMSIVSGFSLHIILVIYFLLLGCYGLLEMKSKI